MTEQMSRLPQVRRREVLEAETSTIRIGHRHRVLRRQEILDLERIAGLAAKWSRDDGQDYAPGAVSAVRAISAWLSGGRVDLSIRWDSPAGSLAEVRGAGGQGRLMPMVEVYLALLAFGMTVDQLRLWEEDPITLSVRGLGT